MAVDTWIVIAVVIVIGALAVDRTRAYRALPQLVSRLRRRTRAAARPATLGVDSGELPSVGITRSDFAGTEKELRNGEGHQSRRERRNGS